MISGIVPAVNAWLERGAIAKAFCIGKTYVDTGTVDGHREANWLLAFSKDADRSAPIANGPRIASIVGASS